MLDSSGHLEEHDFGSHKIKFSKDLQHELHHLANMTHEERRDLFHEAKTSGDAYFSPRPGIHMVIKRDHSGGYTMERAHH